MADNSLPNRELPKAETPALQSGPVDTDRRVFIGRAAIAALPVVLATVRGRSVHAQGTVSCPASATMSSCGPSK
jgi:hypothetical protein